MPVITRRLPQSNVARHKAINTAQFRQINLPPATIILNPATVIRLNNGHTNYGNSMTNIEDREAALHNNTPQKDSVVDATRTYSSHFIQVFNLGVARGKYPKAHRSYFGLDIESADVPDMGQEVQVMTVAGNIVEGDARRVTIGGGLPMANPDALDVNGKAVLAVPLLLAQAVLSDALRDGQVALDTLNVEADNLVKRVWDEVEAYYGELPAETKRAYARDWGVVYITEGVSATLTGFVKNGLGEPQAGVTIILIETGATAVTNAEGRYELVTSVTGTVTLRVTEGMPPVNYDTEVTIPEDHDGIIIEVADIVIA